MKILHTSDWHLGQKFINHDRDEEHHLALQWLLQLIKEQQVEAIIVAGDIFDTFNPANRAQELYYDFLVQLRNTSCRHVVITGGNHDSPSMLNAPRKLLKALNISVLGAVESEISDEIFKLKNDAGEVELVVAAVPFLRDRDLLNAMSGESGLERVQRIRKGIAAHYAEAGLYCEQFKDMGVPILATGHLYAQGATASDKQDNIYIGDISNIAAKDFPEIFSYLALGHLHRAQPVAGKAHIRYSGSLIPLSFSEVRDEKSVTILVYEREVLKQIEVIPAPAFRRLKTVKGSVEEIREKLVAFAERHKNELRPWVEIIVCSDTVQPDLDHQLRSFSAELPLEILKVRIDRSAWQHEEDAERPVNLSELEIIDVFRKKCQRFGVSPEEMPELEMTFRELHQSLGEES